MFSILSQIDSYQKAIVEQHGIPCDSNGRPLGQVADGEYPIMINGLKDYVLIKNDKMYICRYKDNIIGLTWGDK